MGGPFTGVLLLAFFVGLAAGLPPAVQLSLLYGAVVCAILADLDHPGGPLTRALAQASQLTYSSYMLHMFVLNIAISFFANRVLHLSGAAANAALLVAFVAIWPISYLSLIYFERPSRTVIASWRPGIKKTPALFGGLQSGTARYHSVLR